MRHGSLASVPTRQVLGLTVTEGRSDVAILALVVLRNGRRLISLLKTPVAGPPRDADSPTERGFMSNNVGDTSSLPARRPRRRAALRPGVAVAVTLALGPMNASVVFGLASVNFFVE